MNSSCFTAVIKGDFKTGCLIIFSLSSKVRKTWKYGFC